MAEPAGVVATRALRAVVTIARRAGLGRPGRARLSQTKLVFRAAWLASIRMASRRRGGSPRSAEELTASLTWTEVVGSPWAVSQLAKTVPGQPGTRSSRWSAFERLAAPKPSDKRSPA